MTIRGRGLRQLACAAALVSLFVSMPAAAETMVIDWVISKEAIANSTQKNDFPHQVRWDFVASPKASYRSTNSISAPSGAKLLTGGEELHAVRGVRTRACTVAKSRDRAFASSKGSVCLADTDGDGSFDTAYTGKFRKDQRTVFSQSTIQIQPLAIADAVEAVAAPQIKGRLWVTAAIDHKVRMEFFVGSGPYMKHCTIPGGSRPSEGPVVFDCGIPGLGVRVDNPSAERRDRQVSVTLPDRPIALTFSPQGVFFWPY